MAKPKLNTYHVQGVLQFMIPHDVDWKVEAYSIKQAIHKTYLKLRSDSYLKKLNKTLVYNETKKLKYYLIK